MKNVGRFAGVAVALLAITPVVAADPPQSPAQSPFTKVDKNGDGKLGPDEVKNQMLFKRMDTDSDGFVSQKEAQAHAKRRGTREGAAVAAGARPRQGEQEEAQPHPDHQPERAHANGRGVSDDPAFEVTKTGGSLAYT